ncbi:MAG TPA: DNA polymerase III subunit delta [Gemmatimonadales bacterium]|jgi:DNA polymerase-3 subunit delta|nr:DNA polymerase III subunit delta [Gemmatimonadales bacterium]
MAALTLDALLRSLKKGGGRDARLSDPVYLLYGDEDVLKDEAVRALVDVAVGSSRDFNLDVRFAPDLTPEAFHALVNTPPMLADRRAVVIRGVDQLGKRKTKLRDEVVRYLAAPNPTTLLVLVVAAGEEPDGEILGASTSVNLEPLAAERVPRWLQHRATTLGITLATDAAELLLKAVGNDLSTLSRELEKLASLTGGDAARVVSAEDVSSLVGVRRGETIFDLVEAALERHAARAAQLVEPVLEQAGMSGVKIISLLGTHLVGTALARAERDRGVHPSRLPDTLYRQMQTVRPYGMRSYKEEATRWSTWSALWTARELGNALRAALAADNALKTATVTDDRGIVAQLVLGFAVTKREAA